MINILQEARDLGTHLLATQEYIRLCQARDEYFKDQSNENEIAYQKAGEEYNALIRQALNIVVFTSTEALQPQGGGGCGGGGCSSCGGGCGGESDIDE